jgi:hypothetical protein
MEHWWNHNLQGKNEKPGEKPASFPLCPPQIPDEIEAGSSRLDVGNYPPEIWHGREPASHLPPPRDFEK